MSMSTRVIGFTSNADATYQKHAAVLNACINAEVEELPKETAKYFGSKYPDESLLESKLEIEIRKHEYREDMQDGFEVYVGEIPEGVFKIRFVNSY